MGLGIESDGEKATEISDFGQLPSGLGHKQSSSRPTKFCRLAHARKMWKLPPILLMATVEVQGISISNRHCNKTNLFISKTFLPC